MEFNIGIFQGLATLLQNFQEDLPIALMRVFLIFLGFALIYLARKGILEALIMVPMGLGMATINAAVLIWEEETGGVAPGTHGTLFLNPLVEKTDHLMAWLQIDWLQPIYTLTFSNGLIACLVLMGVGVLLDVGFVMARPFQSMFIALCAELGTVVIFPIAVAAGLTPAEAGATATIGGADGPMILFTSLILANDLFIPITVVAYLYLGLTYGGYPYLIRLLVPQRIRALEMPPEKVSEISSSDKVVFAVIACTVLSLLFPVAAPLFLSLFLGVVIRESDLGHFAETFGGPVLYGATFFLGLLLGVLCEANTLLDQKVLILLLLGIGALTISGIGGLIGGYILYFWSGKKYNPVIGIAGVSCVPTTAKVAQKMVAAENPDIIVLPHALGASISGVITSAIFASIFISQLK
uniref:oxaloacetate decarboxylase (Na(+) extruding) n=2 Tax=unclassified Candidatus Kentrum TaxID=2643149 RepID=A0A450ZYG7_9GAMM|nr:MAG: oxaloacetate decarboxylase, beta subunit [Candidatus Kentron sp. LPFa]VFK27279.1 MAG: oxaloacetate decarboxylase, beta subunit [Candidatus Kentron sp. LPFa]VFK58808.1 MAG: oxaloacetate decarboxylase, beta subunit [Candidatus Kentron sp. UNK]VFK68582.1 MAG: oxaloacetate decarboxylase, beta subunit [Candidatus Kentron sp. UNK]